MAVEGLRVGTEAGASPLPPAREIPSTFFSSVKSWWGAGAKESSASEERLLRMIPFYQSKSWPRQSDRIPVVGTSSQIPLSKPKHYINQFAITPLNSSSSTVNDPPTGVDPVVMMHGYGAGLGFYFRNFVALGKWVARTGAPVYALDWLGMGRSARPPFAIKAKRDDIPGRVHAAEAFFVDSLEEWRQKAGVERMTLVGHSLGAYLSVVYALKYPQRVGKLILLSPAGVLGDPDAAQPGRELTESQADVAPHNRHNRQSAILEAASPQRVKEVEEEQKNSLKKQTRRERFLTYLWEEGFSPFQVVRTLTVFGPMLVGRYTSRRFSGLTEEETRNMNDYILNLTLAKGSGEYCISHILAPFAHARLPIVDRISAVKCPVVFAYGDHDWMNPEGGVQSLAKLKAAGNDKVKFYIIDDAGHHVYLDNPDMINKLLTREFDAAALDR